MKPFEQWLTESQGQRDALFEHAKKPIPSDKGLLDQDIEKSIRAAEAAGAQLAMSRYYLTEARMTALKSIGDVKGSARDITIEDAVKQYELLKDQLENLAKSLNSRVRAACNGRRSLL